MDENIWRAVVWLDKAKPFLGVPPFHYACCHGYRLWDWRIIFGEGFGKESESPHRELYFCREISTVYVVAGPFSELWGYGLLICWLAEN